MNNVILNGVNSNTIRGLLIQELPPISKPLMRTEVYEVDGRDGDITTKLGYSAYDKEMVIGLHGNFDINAVISFFDSEGVVTFSNEPDKYYKYQIIEQIDFERLVRFRIATVTLHVQPFKYSVTEEPIVIDNISQSTATIPVTNSGNTVAKPKITIRGTGTVNVSVRGSVVFEITLSSEIESITIDSEQLEAYDGSTLKNRQVVGDYGTFVLEIGTNEIVVVGNVSSVAVENYSRWI